MIRRVQRLLAIACLLPALASPKLVRAQNAVTLFADDFEAAPAGLGSLSGYNGWTHAPSFQTNTSGTIDGAIPGSNRSAYVGIQSLPPAEGQAYAWIAQPLAIAHDTSRPVYTLTGDLLVADSTNGHRDSFTIELWTKAGKLLAEIRLRNHDLGLSRRALGDTASTSVSGSFARSQRYGFTITVDALARKWSASLDPDGAGGVAPTVIADDQALADTSSAIDIGSIEATWYFSNTANRGDNRLVLDNLSLVADSGPYIFVRSGPTSLTVDAGQPVSLAVDATGAALSFQWYKNGVSLAGATASSLPIAAVQPTDGGLYRVGIGNTAGSISQGAYRDATLFVRASGHPVLAWGDSGGGTDTLTLPTGVDLSRTVAIAAGYPNGYALRSNGSVVSWGDDTVGQVSQSPTLTDAIAIAASESRAMALRADGTVVSWGYNVGPAPAGLDDVVAIAAGQAHSLALRGDGTVLAWGDNSWGQCDVPPSLGPVVAIAAGRQHNYALQTDGTIVAWGRNTYHECEVPENLASVIAIFGGAYGGMAIDSEGTAHAWGIFSAPPPADLPPVIAVACGTGDHYAILADGSARSWSASSPEPDVPEGINDLVAVSAYHTTKLLLRAETAPVVLRSPASRSLLVGQTSILHVHAGLASAYQWYAGESGDTSAPVVGATRPWLVTPPASTDASYWVRVSNLHGHVDSAAAVLALVELPTLTEQGPAKTGVFSGSTATFTVSASGGALSYQWYQGVSGDTSAPVSGATGAAYTTPALNVTARYWVRVTNAAGSIDSQTFLVTVIRQPLDDWTWLHPSPQGNALRGTAATADRFIVTGGNGTILTSEDGLDWTPRDSGVSAFLQAVATHPSGTCIAVAGQAVTTSTDGGLTWTPRTTPLTSSFPLYGVSYGGDRAVAVGNGGRILTSDDHGATWTQQTSGSTARLRAVASSGSLWVAVGLTGTILTSPDGVAWTARTSGTTVELQAVLWRDGRFLAVGAGSLLSSTDGMTWQSLPSPGGGSTVSLFWTGSAYVAGFSNTTGALLSRDGANWALANTLPGLHAGVSRDSIAIAVDAWGGIHRSTDGLTWTSLASALSTQTLSASARHADRELAVGWATASPVRVPVIHAASLADPWQKIDLPLPSQNALASGPALVVSVGDSGVAARSVDGVNWTASASGVTDALRAAIWDGTQFLAAGEQERILTSPDGLVWTSRRFVSGGPMLNGLAHHSSLRVAVGSGRILTSPDSVAWTSRSAGGSTYYGVTHGADLFVAVGGSGVIRTSPDGITWTVRTSGTTQNLYSVASSGDQFLAVGGTGVVLSSPDGLTWTLRAPFTDRNLRHVRWDGQNFVAVGDSGLIAKLSPKLRVSVPTISPRSSAFAEPPPITLTTATPDAEIRYTLDGSDPDSNSPLYTAPFTPAGFVEIRARAFRENWTTSAVVSATFFDAAAPPVILSAPTIVAPVRPATLAISASGHGLSYQWYQGSSGDTTRPIHGATGSSYLTPLLGEPASYWVRVSNSAASTDSASIQVGPGSEPLDDLALLHPSGGAILGLIKNSDTWIAVGEGGLIRTSTDAHTWTQRTGPTREHLRTVVWTGSRFVAVGDAGLVLTSVDGTSWQTRVLSASALSGLVWTGARLVAVGQNGTAFTSPDGLAWTPAPTATFANLTGVAGTDALLIAVGERGAVITSSNGGATWTGRHVNDTNHHRGIAYSAGRFLAVLGANLRSSIDGVTWNDLGWGTGTLNQNLSIAPLPGGGFLVPLPDGGVTSVSAAGVGGTYATATTTGTTQPLHALWSDGDTQVAGGAHALLTSRSAPSTAWSLAHFTLSAGLSGLAVSDTQLVAVGYSGTYTSSDGLAWTLANETGADRVRRVGDRFLALSGTKIFHADDSLTWIETSLPTSLKIYDVAGSSTRWVAVGAGSAGTGIFVTDNQGANWYSRASGTNQGLYAILWTGSQFVACGGNGVILTSPDGDTWTARTSGTTQPLRALAQSPSLLVAVGDGATIRTSPDGVTWTARTISSGRGFLSVAWNGSAFVAVSTTGRIMSSPDGITWTNRLSGTTANLTSVTRHGNDFVIVGAAVALRSTDGIAWTGVSYAPAIGAVRGLAVNDSKIIAAGGGIIRSSDHGSSWAPVFAPLPANLFDVTSGPSLRVAVGSLLTDSNGANDQNQNIGNLFTSADGQTWTPRYVANGATLNRVRQIGSLHIAAGANGQIVTSSDGVTWTVRTTGSTANLNALASSGGRHIAAGRVSSTATIDVLTSTNGTTWTLRNFPFADTPQDALWDGHRFVLLGQYALYASTDGAAWQILGSTPYIDNGTRLAWTGGQYLLVGSNGRFSSSYDARSWTFHPTGSTQHLSSVLWTGDRLLLGGGGATILATPDLPILGAPATDPAPGTYPFPLLVKLSPPTPDATLRYTLDGTPPTETSSLYTGPFSLYGPHPVLLQARAYLESHLPGPATTALFTPQTTPTSPSFTDYAASLGLTGEDAAPDATPFPDGLPNLVRYALALDAAPPPSHLPFTSTVLLNDERHLVMEFRLRKQLHGVTLIPEHTIDLASPWQPVPAIHISRLADDDPETERHLVSLPLDGTRRFLRLRAAHP